MKPSPHQLVRRILVALDSSPASLEALLQAASLAGAVGAHLEGIFVEDDDVLRAAALPCTSELSLPSGARRPLERKAVEAELRAMAAAARDALATAARERRIRWSFRVARGRVTPALLEAARQADLLVLGRTGRGLEAGPGETALSAAARAPRSVLFQAPGTGVRRQLLVAYDGSPGAERAVELALLLAPDEARPVRLLVIAAAGVDAERISAEARARHPSDDAVPLWIGGGRRADLVHAVRGTTGILVLAADSPTLGGDGPAQLLEDFALPLLIVR